MCVRERQGVGEKERMKEVEWKKKREGERSIYRDEIKRKRRYKRCNDEVNGIIEKISIGRNRLIKTYDWLDNAFSGSR